MKIKDVMTREAQACSPSDTLNHAAALMWDHDCGCVPVVDGERRVVGMVTDRDICMAAYTQGRTLHEMTAEQVMSRVIHCCPDTETTETAQKMMREHQVRRLPVVNARGKLVGIVSLSDLMRRSGKSRTATQRDEVVDTLSAICRPRTSVQLLDKQIG